MIAPNKDKKDRKVTVLPCMLLDFPDILVLEEEFNHAITGLNHECNRVVYDVEKVIEQLQDDSSPTMTKDEAWDYFYFNVVDAFPSDKSPVWMFPVECELEGIKHANKKEKKSNHTGQSTGID